MPLLFLASHGGSRRGSVNNPSGRSKSTAGAPIQRPDKKRPRRSDKGRSSDALSKGALLSETSGVLGRSRQRHCLPETYDDTATGLLFRARYSYALRRDACVLCARPDIDNRGGGSGQEEGHIWAYLS